MLLNKTFVINSKDVKGGEVFVALQGIRDGHDFVLDALEKGASYALVRSGFKLQGYNDKLIHAKSNDVLAELTNLAKQKIAQYKAHGTKVICVTGTVGKTSVKNLIHFILCELGCKSAKTEQNYNNEIGLPLSILNARCDADAVVLEIGMRASGEIGYLAEIAQPDVSVITNISAVHAEFFSNLAEIAAAKSECIKYTCSTVIAHDAIDTESLNVVKSTVIESNKKLTLCNQDIINRYVCGDGKTSFSLSIDRVFYQFEIDRILSKNILMNIIMSIVAIKECGFDISGFLKINLNKFFNDKLLQAGRGRVITLDDTTKLIDDSYNASPLSMQNALSTLRYYDGTKLAIIGDMLELGDIAIREHFELVDHLANIDNVIVIGHLMKNLSDEMQKRGKKCEYYENVDSFLAHFDTNYHKLLTFLKKINVILVKSSNSIKLSRIIDFIDQNNGNES